MSTFRPLTRTLFAFGVMVALMVVSQPVVVLARDEVFPVITHNPKTDDQEIYIWSSATEKAFKVVSITDDDLLNFASAPVGSTIQFPADYNQGTVSLTYRGKGEFTGQFQSYTFSFKREDVAYMNEGNWDAWHLAQARVKALRTMNRPGELAIAEAVLGVLTPIHHKSALVAEKQVVEAVVIKVTENKDTGGQELWAWVPASKTGFKLASLAKDDLRTFASARPGTTVTFPAEGNRGMVTLTFTGNGGYTGTYLGASFSFTRSEMGGILLGDPGLLSLATARVPALQSLGRTDEWNFAKVVLDALKR